VQNNEAHSESCIGSSAAIVPCQILAVISAYLWASAPMLSVRCRTQAADLDPSLMLVHRVMPVAGPDQAAYATSDTAAMCLPANVGV